MGEIKDTCKILVGMSEGNKPLKSEAYVGGQY
jgi:hypothetical protein